MEKIVLVLGLVALLGGAYYLLDQEPQVATTNNIDPSVVSLYTNWKKQYNKKYASPDQDWYRLTVFNENYQEIKSFQEGPEQTYTLEVNQFMDISNTEFVETYLGTSVPLFRNGAKFQATNDAPNAVDWRTQGVLNPVKNQASCGSCWAFSAVGALESHFAIAGKGLLQFSEQELVDCSTSYGNNGCGGGLMDNAFHYVQEHGIGNGSNYPYTARDQKCAKQEGTYKISGWTDVAAGNCQELQTALAKGPVSVAVDASKWQFYKGGVFSDCASNLNHGVTLVAFSDSEWVIRNSWSAAWGEAGHIKLAKGDTCGVCQVASFPNL